MTTWKSKAVFSVHLASTRSSCSQHNPLDEQRGQGTFRPTRSASPSTSPFFASLLVATGAFVVLAAQTLAQSSNEPTSVKPKTEQKTPVSNEGKLAIEVQKLVDLHRTQSKVNGVSLTSNLTRVARKPT